MQWWLAYLAIGLAVGFFAGLLGIGGGAVMVPLLVIVFTAQGFPADHVMHMALATSMAASRHALAAPRRPGQRDHQRAGAATVIPVSAARAESRRP